MWLRDIRTADYWERALLLTIPNTPPQAKGRCLCILSLRIAYCTRELTTRVELLFDESSSVKPRKRPMALTQQYAALSVLPSGYGHVTFSFGRNTCTTFNVSLGFNQGGAVLDLGGTGVQNDVKTYIQSTQSRRSRDCSCDMQTYPNTN